MAKITDVQTPLGSGNILKPSTWVSMILSVVALLFALAIGQNVVSRVERATGGRLDGTVEPITRAPVNVRNREAV